MRVTALSYATHSSGTRVPIERPVTPSLRSSDHAYNDGQPTPMRDRRCLPVPLSALLHPTSPPVSTYNALRTVLSCCRPPAPWTRATQVVLEGFTTVYTLHLLRKRAVVISLLLHVARALLQAHPSHVQVAPESQLGIRSGPATRTMVPLPAATLVSVVTSAMIPLRIILYLQRALQHLYLHLTLCALSLCVLTSPPPSLNTNPITAFVHRLHTAEAARVNNSTADPADDHFRSHIRNARIAPWHTTHHAHPQPPLAPRPHHSAPADIPHTHIQLTQCRRSGNYA